MNKGVEARVDVTVTATRRRCPRCGRLVLRGPRVKWCSEGCRVMASAGTPLDAQHRPRARADPGCTGGPDPDVDGTPAGCLRKRYLRAPGVRHARDLANVAHERSPVGISILDEVLSA